MFIKYFLRNGKDEYFGFLLGIKLKSLLVILWKNKKKENYKLKQKQKNNKIA